MKESFFATGMNHGSAPVEVREAFELSDASIRDLYAAASLRSGVEWMVLSTCNRTEAWLHGKASDLVDVQNALKSHCGSWPEDHTFLYEGEEAIRHIVEVVSGLRSQVLGDAQILSQVKSAYRLSSSSSAVGPRLHHLMHLAFATAKRVISSTALGSGAHSVAGAAVATLRAHLAAEERALGDLSVLVLGCGKMGVRTLKELMRQPPAACFLANRTESRAAAVGDKYGALVMPWDRRLEAIEKADVVFVATGAPGHVVSRGDFGTDGPGRTIFVDVSVPRNVDPDLAQERGVVILNIDELTKPSDAERRAVRRDLDTAREICRMTAREAVGWQQERKAVEPAVHVLQEAFESVRRREVERNIHRFADEDREQVERLTRSIMQKLLAIPIVRLKGMSNGEAELVRSLEVLGSLFDRGDCGE
ncbi:MAG TPA: glutamyl-tRNA reductase [Rhodothermales bacterium]|nr:glutamyl-tRNA reductase [Rhodothermales bacterium]